MPDRVRLLVPPHWRREVSDVARAMSDVCADGSPMVVRRLPLVAAAIAAGAARLPSAPRVWLLSDGFVPLPIRAGIRARDVVVSLWWNQASEILENSHTLDELTSPPPLMVCFFDEVARHLATTQLDTVQVPYAFSRPERAIAPTSTAISYTGEVDVSDRCFSTVAQKVDVASLSDSAWGLAEDVVEGGVTLADVGDTLAHRLDDRAVAQTALWAVRNRVRYLLMKAVVGAFPGRVRLRGSDWQELGFEAQPTDFGRGRRFRDYRENRVSLDLGSKSTHAPLYPRTADIMAVGGGLLQWRAGRAACDENRPLNTRQVADRDSLLARIDQMLSADALDLRDENVEIQTWYCEQRRRAAVELAGNIVHRLR